MLATHYPSVLSSEVLSRLVLPDHQLPSTHLDRFFLAGTVLVAIGGLGRLWCFRALGRHFTYTLAVRKDHALVTTGPYAIVRHPSYLSATLGMLGMILVVASPGSFVQRCGWLNGQTFGTVVAGAWAVQNVLVWVFFGARCRREDAFLRECFREEWDKYSRRVRHRMIPGVY